MWPQDEFYSEDDPHPGPTPAQMTRYQRENRLAICLLIFITLALLGSGLVMLVARLSRG